MAKKQTKQKGQKKQEKQTKKIKQQKNVIYEAETSNNYELKKLFIFIAVIAILFGLFYIITLFIDKDDKTTNKREQNAAVIQYDEIILGTLLTQPNDSYYVLIAKEDSNSTYTTYTSQYKTKDGALRIYTSDLDSPFNKMYVSDDSNFDINNVSELRIKEDTLIKVENHELVEYFEGKTDIIGELQALNEN